MSEKPPLQVRVVRREEPTVRIEGEEVIIRSQKIEKSVDSKESLKNCYEAFAYHRLKYFEANHSDENKAVKLVEELIREFINEEKNRENRNPLDSILWYSRILFLSTVILILLMFFIHPREINITWLNTDLIYTIIASLFALSIALRIYWQQQTDRKKMLKQSLKIHLDYIIYSIPRSNVISRKAEDEAHRKRVKDGDFNKDDFKSIKDTHIQLKKVDWVRMGYVDNNLIEDLITSGYFNESYKELITLQASVKYYNELREQLNEYDSFFSDAIKDDERFMDKQHHLVFRINNSVSSIKKNIEDIQNKLYN